MHVFLTMMLPVIIVVSAPLRGNTLTTMFLALGIDSNNESLPLAYGFGICNDSRSWNWFLKRLRNCLSGVRDVAFICNISDVTASAISNVFPTSYIGYCCHNMFITLVGRCRDAINYEHLYWQTCKAYTMGEFEENFVALQNAIPSQAHWLDSIGHEKWARSCLPNLRFNVLTAYTYMANSSSLIFMDAEDVPITSLLDGALSSLMIAYNQRRQYGGNNKLF